MNANLPTHTGNLRIGYVSSNMGPSYWSVEMRDENGVTVFQADVPLEDYGRLLSGRETAIPYQLPGAHLAGKFREHKTVFVPGEPGYKTRRQDAAIHIGPFEVDGWRGYDSDFGNGHKSGTVDGVKGYYVAFHRFVEPLSGNPVDPSTGLVL
jgi:hypothetical protein